MKVYVVIAGDKWTSESDSIIGIFKSEARASLFAIEAQDSAGYVAVEEYDMNEE